MFLFVNNNSGILFLTLGDIVTAVKREIFEAFSRITKSIEYDSRID